MPGWAFDPRPPKRLRDPEALRRFALAHLGEPCEVCERRPGVEAHHRIFRSRSGDDKESNLVWICRPCHDDIHGGR